MEQENDIGRAEEKTRKYSGSCHCGAVRFEAELDLKRGVARCNCTVCTKISQTGAIGKPTALRVLSGEQSMGSYAWGGKTATRYFCRSCGVHCFARGHLQELGGDYVSINVNCLDGVDVNELPTVFWDGRHDNWQAGPRKEPWPILAKVGSS